ncbi:MAG: archease [Desulfobacterium sp.]
MEWLNELLYWIDTRMMVFHHFDFLETGDKHLKVILAGAVVSTLKVHIKAVTYHDLTIIRSKNGLEATVVFDV